MPATDTRPLTDAEARALLAHVNRLPLINAAVHLCLFAGLRSGEALRLTVADYTPGHEPTVRIARSHGPGRTIRIASAAAAAVDDYLERKTETSPDEPLLLGLRSDQLVRAVRQAAAEAGLTASVHDLRRAAVAWVVGMGFPADQVEAYFGFSKTEGRKDLVPLREGWDAELAAALNFAFDPEPSKQKDD